jgi:hypothetical protein
LDQKVAVKQQLPITWLKSTKDVLSVLTSSLISGKREIMHFTMKLQRSFKNKLKSLKSLKRKKQRIKPKREELLRKVKFLHQN